MEFKKKNLYLYIAILTAIGGFISGIFVGFTNAIVNVTSTGLYTEDVVTTTFNTASMFETWAASFVTALLFYAIHLHLCNQNLIIRKLYEKDVKNIDHNTSESYGENIIQGHNCYVRVK